MNTASLRIGLIASLLTLSTCTQADVFKWVDETGGIHYGDTPDRSGARRVEIEDQPVRAEEAADLQQRRQRVQDWVEARRAEREQKRSERAEQQKQVALREEHCRDLETRLKDRELGGVWYRMGEDGARHYLSDEEIARRTDSLREQLAADCR